VRIGADADALVQAFAEQSTRLEALAGALFELTGVPCEAIADPVPVAGAGGFEIESFGGPALGAEETMAAVPAAAPASLAPAAPSHPETCRLFAVDEAPATATAAAVRPLSGSIFAPEEPRFDAAEPPASTASAVPTEEDRIYDLVEFGAVALDAAAPAPATPPAMEEDDHIYDLCELGAVALG